MTWNLEKQANELKTQSLEYSMKTLYSKKILQQNYINVLKQMLRGTTTIIPCKVHQPLF